MDGSPHPRPGPRRRAFRSGFAAPQFRTNTSRPCPPSTSRSGPSSPRGTSSAARSPTMSSGGAVRHPGTSPPSRFAVRSRASAKPGPERTHIRELDQYRPTPPADLLLRARGRSWRTRRRVPSWSPFGKLRQPHGRSPSARSECPSRATNDLRRPGVTRAGGLPPQAFRRHHLQRHGRRRSRQLPADPAPLRGSGRRRPLHRLLLDRSRDPHLRDLWRNRGIAIDPHTAVGLLGLRRQLQRRGPHVRRVSSWRPRTLPSSPRPSSP